MWKRIYDFQKWVAKNRLVAWWSIFTPALITLLLITKNDLRISEEIIESTDISFPYKVINFPSLVILLRITMITVCVVTLIICFLFPVFRVGKEGVQWTKELEEELTQASSEITAEEVGLLIREEANRWSQVLRWMEVDSWKKEDFSSLLRDLLYTLWETFPEHYISVTIIKDGQTQALSHPLLPWLITEERERKEESIGFKISFSRVNQFLLMIYPRYEEGFSPIDESYLMIMGQIFSQVIEDKGISLCQLLSHFQVEVLTIRE